MPTDDQLIDFIASNPTLTDAECEAACAAQRAVLRSAPITYATLVQDDSLGAARYLDVVAAIYGQVAAGNADAIGLNLALTSGGLKANDPQFAAVEAKLLDLGLTPDDIVKARYELTDPTGLGFPPAAAFAAVRPIKAARDAQLAANAAAQADTKAADRSIAYIRKLYTDREALIACGTLDAPLPSDADVLAAWTYGKTH